MDRCVGVCRMLYIKPTGAPPPNKPPNKPTNTQTNQKVALDFHKLRERAPFLFVSPALNKVYYALMGLKDFFWRCVLSLFVCGGVSVLRCRFV